MLPAMETHWFIRFAKQTNLFIGVAATLWTLWLVSVGVPNMKRCHLIEYFGEEEARAYEAKTQMSKKIPDLFDAKFYQSSKESQIKQAEKFWETSIAPIARKLPPEEMAASKRVLIESVKRLSE